MPLAVLMFRGSQEKQPFFKAAVTVKDPSVTLSSFIRNQVAHAPEKILYDDNDLVAIESGGGYCCRQLLEDPISEFLKFVRDDSREELHVVFPLKALDPLYLQNSTESSLKVANVKLEYFQPDLIYSQKIHDHEEYLQETDNEEEMDSSHRPTSKSCNNGTNPAPMDSNSASAIMYENKGSKMNSSKRPNERSPKKRCREFISQSRNCSAFLNAENVNTMEESTPVADAERVDDGPLVSANVGKSASEDNETEPQCSQKNVNENKSVSAPTTGAMGSGLLDNESVELPTKLANTNDTAKFDVASPGALIDANYNMNRKTSQSLAENMSPKRSGLGRRISNDTQQTSVAQYSQDFCSASNTMRFPSELNPNGRKYSVPDGRNGGTSITYPSFEMRQSCMDDCYFNSLKLAEATAANASESKMPGMGKMSAAEVRCTSGRMTARAASWRTQPNAATRSMEIFNASPSVHTRDALVQRTFLFDSFDHVVGEDPLKNASKKEKGNQILNILYNFFATGQNNKLSKFVENEQLRQRVYYFLRHHKELKKYASSMSKNDGFSNATSFGAREYIRGLTVTKNVRMKHRRNLPLPYSTQTSALQFGKNAIKSIFSKVRHDSKIKDFNISPRDFFFAKASGKKLLRAGFVLGQTVSCEIDRTLYSRRIATTHAKVGKETLIFSCPTSVGDLLNSFVPFNEAPQDGHFDSGSFNIVERSHVVPPNSFCFGKVMDKGDTLMMCRGKSRNRDNLIYYDHTGCCMKYGPQGLGKLYYCRVSDFLTQAEVSKMVSVAQIFNLDILPAALLLILRYKWQLSSALDEESEMGFELKYKKNHDEAWKQSLEEIESCLAVLLRYFYGDCRSLRVCDLDVMMWNARLMCLKEFDKFFEIDTMIARVKTRRWEKEVNENSLRLNHAFRITSGTQQSHNESAEKTYEKLSTFFPDNQSVLVLFKRFTFQEVYEILSDTIACATDCLTAEAFLSLTLVSEMIFDGSLPTDARLRGFHQVKYNKMATCINEVVTEEKDFAGVGNDSHVIKFFSAFNPEMSRCSRSEHNRFVELLCRGINPQVGWFANELIGQLDQFLKRGGKLRQFALNIFEKLVQNHPSRFDHVVDSFIEETNWSVNKRGDSKC